MQFFSAHGAMGIPGTLGTVIIVLAGQSLPAAIRAESAAALPRRFRLPKTEQEKVYENYYLIIYMLSIFFSL